MANSFTNLLYHLVFSTKHREPRVTSDIRDELYRYIGGILRNEHGKVIEIGGMPDHLHILAKLHQDMAVSAMLRLIKANSSKWINEKWRSPDPFHWQVGYGAFTVSESGVQALRQYIQRQQEHHRTMTFQEEFLALLRKHGIEFDERYVFD